MAIEVSVIGFDIAKNVFQVHGVDRRGAAVLRKRLRRAQVSEFFRQLTCCVVGMEATRGAHYWARVLRSFAMEEQIHRIHHSNILCQRIAAIEGVGPVIATAVVAAIADGRAFHNGRQFAAWVGLVPRQHSSGEKQRLMGITKRGDPYLRMLLIHGARSVVDRAASKQDSRSRWISEKQQRFGTTKT